MKVFVTGGTGFIGRNLVRRLLQADHDVLCLARKNSNIGELVELGATIVYGDVTDKESIRGKMDGCQWVVNLANVYSFWQQKKSNFAKVNIEGTRNVLECALECGAIKVIHISTYALYENTSNEYPCTEETPIENVVNSEYSRTKYYGELAAWELYKELGLPLVVISPGSVTGPGDNSPMGQYIQFVIDRKLPARMAEDTVYSFVHVDDVVNAIILALEKDDNIGEKYLIGKGQITVKDINKLVATTAQIPLPKAWMPNGLVRAAAYVLTFISLITRRPPLWNMSIDMVKTALHSYRCDGIKAEKDLGLQYTPANKALKDMVIDYVSHKTKNCTVSRT